MTSIPARILAVLLLATNCLCGSLFADQKFDDLRKAAERGDVEAQSSIGNCYINGEGVPKNVAESVKWQRKAALQGYAPAQIALGNIYNASGLVPSDRAEALRWYRMAAEQGDAYAQFNVGFAYRAGAGVEKDLVEGYAWNNLAAVTDDYAKTQRTNLEKVMTLQQVAAGQRRSAELSALIKAR